MIKNVEILSLICIISFLLFFISTKIDQLFDKTTRSLKKQGFNTTSDINTSTNLLILPRINHNSLKLFIKKDNVKNMKKLFENNQ